MKKSGAIKIREAEPSEFETLGQLMVSVYSQLEGFPKKEVFPKYYDLLANIGQLTKNKETKLLIAISDENKLLGGVVYLGDLKYYGTKSTISTITNASGIRLLAVDPTARGMGIGKALTEGCINLAKGKQQSQVLLHTTKTMNTAWGMYERMGFERFPEIDFQEQDMPVFGFRLKI